MATFPAMRTAPAIAPKEANVSGKAMAWAVSPLQATRPMTANGYVQAPAGGMVTPSR